jgi:hypothetical protein
MIDRTEYVHDILPPPIIYGLRSKSANLALNGKIESNIWLKVWGKGNFHLNGIRADRGQITGFQEKRKSNLQQVSG